MTTLVQDNRLLSIQTPLTDGDLILTGFSGSERINGLYEFHLTLMSHQIDIKPKDLVGHRATVTINGDGDSSHSRHFHGLIHQLTQGTITADGLRNYEAKLVPSLWLLTQARHNRVWEQKTVIDILKAVIAPINSLFALSTSKVNASQYAPRELCVQFNESDYHFITRLLAEEGINFYFEHQSNQHTLVLTDTPQGYMDCTPYDIPYIQNAPNQAVIHRWSQQFQFHAGVVKSGDHNEQTPTNQHSQQATTTTDLPNIKSIEQEVFYRYLFEQGKNGAHAIHDTSKSQYCHRHMESLESQYNTAEGSSNVISFCAGGRFQLSQHPTNNDTYLISDIYHQASDGNDQNAQYSNQFKVIPSTCKLRPPLTQQRHLIQMPQTAEVIETKASGSAEDDPNALVKVKFFWGNQPNSCWIRCSQLMAGKNWGSYFVPQKGQEVIVHFLNGNPDRPIITGTVYHASNTAPPFTATESGIRTQSSDYNELRFEDKAGHECVSVRAGKDYHREVINDERIEVQHDQTIEVGNQRSVTVKEADDQLTVNKGHQATTLDQGNQTLTIKKGNQTTTINKGDQTTKIDSGNQKTSLSKGNQTTKLSKGDHSLDVGGSSDIKAKQTIKMSANQAIELKVAGSSIAIKPAGIELKMGANSIKMNASGVTINGTLVKLNGSAMTEVKGGAMMKVQGGVTMIN